MRISDWSSDVCSSDLPAPVGLSPTRLQAQQEAGQGGGSRSSVLQMEQPGNTEHHENSSGRPCGQRYRQGTVKTERLHQLDAEIEEEADCDAPRQHEPDTAAAGQTQAETARKSTRLNSSH